MGGLAPLVQLLQPEQAAELQARAAFVLGTAAANNAPFQQQLLEQHPETLRLLLQLLASGTGGGAGDAKAEAAAKALYCLSALLRLSAPARGAFYRAAGLATLQVALRGGAAGSDGSGADGSSGVRVTAAGLSLQRKALGLLADLAQLDGGLDAAAATGTALQLLEAQARLAAAGQGDLDLQEKALLLLQALLNGRPESAASTAQLMVGGHGPATLRRLEEAWRQAAAAEEDDAFLLDLLALLQRVRAAAAAAAPSGVGGGGPTGTLGSVAGGGSREAHTEL